MVHYMYVVKRLVLKLIITFKEWIIIGIVISSIASFISTNIDDIFILMIFFLNSKFKTKQIVLGQYIGIGILVCFSILASIGFSIFPKKYLGLLGFIPIFLGVKAWIDYKKENIEEDNENTIEEKFSSNILKVSMVTIANGADNIGIYIPFFTQMSKVGLIVCIIIFILMTGLWCYIAKNISQYPLIKEKIERYKNYLIPLVFIGIGILILLENNVIGLFLGI